MRAVVLFFPLQITFLEFFEVLLGCAEVTCEQVSETLKEYHRVSGSNTETRKDSPEVEVSEDDTDKKQPLPVGQILSQRFHNLCIC